MCFQILFLNICIDQNLVFLFCYDHFFIFLLFWNLSNFKVSRPRVGPGPAHLFLEKWKFIAKWAGPGPAQGRLTLKSRKKFAVGKKSFFLKNIFFFVFYGCLSFFNGKYRYFATFDQQILAEKLIFRILQHRFSRGSAISKMIVAFLKSIIWSNSVPKSPYFTYLLLYITN